jgi:hypothetical protein
LKPKIKKGYRKARVKRPTDKAPVRGYDSNWEYELHSGILNDWKIHSEKAEYIVEHTYHPDFIREIDGKKIYLEAKGRFFRWFSEDSIPEDWIDVSKRGSIGDDE